MTIWPDDVMLFEKLQKLLIKRIQYVHTIFILIYSLIIYNFVTNKTSIIKEATQMKIKAILLSVAVAATIITGCAQKPAPAPAPAPSTQTKTDPNTGAQTPAKTDATTTASIVNDTAAFEKAISKTGTWIIATLNDLKFDKPLVLEGDFKNGKKDEKGNDVVQRKIALYSQDANKVVTARYILTAPSLTIKSPKARIQSGTFKGDLYVETNDFQLVDAKVDGNVYFANDAAKAGFKADDKSSITGKQEIKKQ
jgi:hypothetical protein